MKNGKDRNVYDVMNDVNVDIETMDMSGLKRRMPV